MGFWKALRTSLACLGAGLLLAAPPLQTAPAQPAAAMDPALAPAVALSHRAADLQAALLSGNPQALQRARHEVEVLRRTYNTLDVTPLVEAMAVWARAQGLEGHPEVGLAALQAVEGWVPELPAVLSARITLMREQGVQGWFWSIPDLLHLTWVRLEHPEFRWLWLVQHLGMLRLMATLLLWGWSLALLLRYRNVLRALWEAPLEQRGVPPLSAAILGAGILSLPVLVGLDPMVAAVFWLFLLAPFLTRVEVKATVFILLLQLVHPALGVMEPWSDREPPPSLLALQMQPQVQPMPPGALRFLPAGDRAFLAGWAQLQQKDWAGAASTFQGLVGHLPEQAEVLNNLGVAHFELGDVPQAEELGTRGCAGREDSHQPGQTWGLRAHEPGLGRRRGKGADEAVPVGEQREIARAVDWPWDRLSRAGKPGIAGAVHESLAGWEDEVCACPRVQ